MLLWLCVLKMLEISCSLLSSVCQTFRQSWLSRFWTRSGEGQKTDQILLQTFLSFYSFSDLRNVLLLQLDIGLSSPNI